MRMNSLSYTNDFLPIYVILRINRFVAHAIDSNVVMVKDMHVPVEGTNEKCTGHTSQHLRFLLTVFQCAEL